MNRAVLPAAVLVIAAACRGQDVPADHAPGEKGPVSVAPSRQPDTGMREVFPGVRADIKARIVEFDAEVPIDCHDPKTPHVFLEVFVCTPDTKEHEALALTRVRPSHVHAALLACGYTPGRPGSWSWDPDAKRLNTHPPAGDALDVFIASRDAAGKEVETRISDWVVSTDGRPFRASDPDRAGWWVFAGSTTARRAGREVYDADGTGTLIGLTTFGMETIAWRDVLSHEAGVQEPEWIADARLVPKLGTRVVIRIRPAAEAPPANPGSKETRGHDHGAPLSAAAGSSAS